MNTHIKAVFWDFGGVFTSSPFDAFARYEQAHGLPHNFLRLNNADNPDSNAWAQFERGEISLDRFDQLFLDETRAKGHPVPGRALLPLLAGDIRPGMVRVLDAVRAHFKVACLTNNAPAGTGAGMSTNDAHARAVADIMAHFDFVLESSQAGVRKPEADFFLAACTKAQVAPEQVVFLDDLGINLKGAKALGMTTLKVITPEQAVTDLETLLDMPLLPHYQQAAE